MAEGMSLESPQEPTIESPQTSPDATGTSTPDPEPEGVVEVQGRRMVPVDALIAERKRVREGTERTLREREIAPLQAQAQENAALRAHLQQVQPYLDHLRQHPELLEPRAPEPAEAHVSDDEARNEARDLELYDAQGQPDLGRAKRIIARRRSEAMSAANHAAQAAIGPITSQTAHQQSRQQFAQRALQRTQDGAPVVDPRVLAQLWAQLPAQLTANQQVADLVLEAAVGKSVLAGHKGTPRPNASTYSESTSGRSGPSFQHSQLTKDIARAAGMTEKAFSEGAKTYRPGETNTLGD